MRLPMPCRRQAHEILTEDGVGRVQIPRQIAFQNFTGKTLGATTELSYAL